MMALVMVAWKWEIGIMTAGVAAVARGVVTAAIAAMRTHGNGNTNDGDCGNCVGDDRGDGNSSAHLGQIKL